MGEPGRVAQNLELQALLAALDESIGRLPGGSPERGGGPCWPAALPSPGRSREASPPRILSGAEGAAGTGGAGLTGRAAALRRRVHEDSDASILEKVFQQIEQQELSLAEAAGALRGAFAGRGAPVGSPARSRTPSPEAQHTPSPRAVPAPTAGCQLCEVLTLQVQALAESQEALAESLAGLGASIVTWAAAAVPEHRGELAGLILGYALPCAGASGLLGELCAELQGLAARARAVAPGKAPPRQPPPRRPSPPARRPERAAPVECDVVGRGRAASVAEGAVVRVLEDFRSSAEGSPQLRRGQCGRVLRCDEDGDALIRFDGVGQQRQWVLKVDLGKLQVVQDVQDDPGEQRQQAPEDAEMLQRSRDALASLCKLGYKEDHPVFVAARDDVEQEKLRVRLFAFLAASGALGVGERTSRRGRAGFCYPLHLAVEANDPGAVAALLWGGADRRLVDSDGLTALDLAREVDDRGSHAAVIAALLRAPPARAP